MEYTPGVEGKCALKVTLDKRSVVIAVETRRALLSARFDRFCLITTPIDGNCRWIYFDDLVYTAQQ